MTTKPRTKPKTKLKKILDKLIHNKEAVTEEENMDSPWSDYEELSLLPLDELEKMVEEEAAKESAEIERATTQAKIDALNEVIDLEKSHTGNYSSKKPETYVADLSQGHSSLPLVTCYTHEDETQDPNLRITHYPPSNRLH